MSASIALPDLHRNYEAREGYPAILAATEPEVRTRIRIEHRRTIKEGWQYETTVEVTFDGLDSDAPALDRLEYFLREARLRGEDERDERNRRVGEAVTA